ncbi:MAG: YncE family protein [Acidimicrobiales bacterium]
MTSAAPAVSTTEAPAAAPTTAAPTTTVAPPTTAAPTTVAPPARLSGVGALGRFPERVYVPNSDSNSLSVIDPATFEVIDTYPTDALPHHVTPAWDLSELYVNNTAGNSLQAIDPESGRITRRIPVTDPYNLYFTPDGADAIVVAERFRRLDIRDPKTWELKAQTPIPHAGPDHLAFSPEGDYLVISAEFSGRLVKVDTRTWEVVGEALDVGGEPIDVVRPPNQRLMLVANQRRGGVHVIDPDAWEERAFVPTGAGAHGILLSHDQRSVYVSNRLGGSMSVLSLEDFTVTDTWRIPGGGSPDMGQLSPDGRRLWIAGRYHGQVYVFDTDTGELAARIPVARGPHGLSYFPRSARPHSVGHNGVYVED